MCHACWLTFAPACSPWGNRKGRNLRAPSPANGSSWNAKQLSTHSPDDHAAGAGALSSHQATQPGAAEPEGAQVPNGLPNGLPNGPQACQAAAAQHAEQGQRSARQQRPRKAAAAEGSPLRRPPPAGPRMEAVRLRCLVPQSIPIDVRSCASGSACHDHMSLRGRLRTSCPGRAGSLQECARPYALGELVAHVRHFFHAGESCKGRGSTGPPEWGGQDKPQQAEGKPAGARKIDSDSHWHTHLSHGTPALPCCKVMTLATMHLSAHC